MGLQKFDACPLAAQIRLQAHQNNRGRGTEVKDFRIPLGTVSISWFILKTVWGWKEGEAYFVNHIL